MPDIVFLYVTAPDLKTAQKLAETLVAGKLAACVNILPGMQSIYEWQGKIEQADEVVMIVKTTVAAAPAARETIIKAHPYETPCIAALPVNAPLSAEAFLKWIEDVANA